MTKTKKGLASQVLADMVVYGIEERKGLDVAVLDLRKITNAFCDFFVICTATSDKHLESIVESVEKEVYVGMKENPMFKEGEAATGWMILDYFNVVLHVFFEDKRQYIGLEELWGDAKVKESK